ncbi:MAG: DNA primase [Paludibacteraceae bacterium]|nr:DNA primase [Paludibacteraceae bacterium]
MIDNITIQRIKEAANIVDVVGDYVTLRRAGTSYKGLCPFHNEKTPSFIVTPSKNICKCFGCGGGGDSISFIMKMENLSYLDALRFLAKKFGITIVEKELTPEEKEQQSLRDKMLDANQWLQDFFEKSMRETQEGRSVGYQYFIHRGLREDIIKKFHLGYSPADYQAYTNAALSQGIKLEHLVALGATVNTGTRTYDKYAGRVMFPIHSISGKVVGFGARTLKADKNVAKYFNPPESEVYNKSENLYGIFYARQAIIKKQKCYVVEGYADVISMHQAGVENIVAPCGTALTNGQIRLLKRVLPSVGNTLADEKYVTMLYDGDSAGQHAAIKNGKLFLAEGLNVRVVTLPPEEDPDSFAQHNNADVVQKYLEENEQDYILFKSNVLLRESGTDPVKKAAAIKDMAETISVIEDPIKRDVYSKEIAPLFHTEQSIIMEYVGKIRKDAAAQKEKERLRGQTFRETPIGQPSGKGYNNNQPYNNQPQGQQQGNQQVGGQQNNQPQNQQQYPDEHYIPDDFFVNHPDITPSTQQGGPAQPQQKQNDVFDKFSAEYLATLNKQYVVERELISLVVNYGNVEVIELVDKDKKPIKALNVVEAIVYDFNKDELELSNQTFKLMLEEADKLLKGDKNADIVKYFQNHADRTVNEAINSILSDDISIEEKLTDADRQFCKEKRDRELFSNLRSRITLMKMEWYKNQKDFLQSEIISASADEKNKDRVKELAEQFMKVGTKISEISSAEGRVINQSIKMETPSLSRYELSTKAELRKQTKTRVKNMTAEEKKKESEDVMMKLENTQQFKSANTILLFHSLPDEVCTHGLIEKYASKKRILLPVVDGEKWYIREYKGDLKTGEYNIQEPTGMNFHNYDSIDLVVVPGVCFDNDLGRVGRGKGYYDRILKEIKAFKIGICFDCQLLSKVPTDEWDVRMDQVLTATREV